MERLFQTQLAAVNFFFALLDILHKLELKELMAWSRMSGMKIIILRLLLREKQMIFQIFPSQEIIELHLWYSRAVHYPQKLWVLIVKKNSFEYLVKKIHILINKLSILLVRFLH